MTAVDNANGSELTAVLVLSESDMTGTTAVTMAAKMEATTVATDCSAATTTVITMTPVSQRMKGLHSTRIFKVIHQSMD